MRKIPTLFQRDEATNRKHVRAEVTPGCEWVLEGTGTPTRKYDGTCFMLDSDSQWWARREVKPGKTPPDGFVEVEHDETTGKTVGWEPAERSGFAKWHTEALGNPHERRPEGTYELCGPKINGDPERFGEHVLIRHDDADKVEIDLPYPVNAPFLFGYLHAMLKDLPIEGIVWHHPDGRMAKIKRRDFPA